MRVGLLHAENILTFDELDLSLGGSPHTIVGPNGAGKSNIVRLLGLVPGALRWALDE
jgi:predicted ATPase